MRLGLFALPLLAIAACDVSSTITRTGETVSYGDKTFDVYVEKIQTTLPSDGTTFRDQRKIVYVESRYLWCEGDCAGVVDATLGP